MVVKEIKTWDCHLGYQCEPYVGVWLTPPSDLNLLLHSLQ